jgi:pyruvate kinase
MVVIVCISARRAVAVLKDLGGLKIRCGKFFAKRLEHGGDRKEF